VDAVVSNGQDGSKVNKEGAMEADVLDRLLVAQNQHELDDFVACFASDYRSEQPVHPNRAFVGREQVRRNWSAVFEGVPDFRAELLRAARADGACWAEWYWHGTRADGTPLAMRGVTIFGVQDDRITWGRLYLEDVDDTGGGNDQIVEHMAAGSE
jgi:hypothetical protein